MIPEERKAGEEPVGKRKADRVRKRKRRPERERKRSGKLRLHGETKVDHSGTAYFYAGTGFCDFYSADLFRRRRAFRRLSGKGSSGKRVSGKRVSG